MVIGTKCKPPPPRGKASCAPKIRIGTTRASVFAITSPNPGSAGCKLPSSVREPSGKTSAPFPDLRTRIKAKRAAVDPLLINWDYVQFGQKPSKQRYFH